MAIIRNWTVRYYNCDGALIGRGDFAAPNEESARLEAVRRFPPASTDRITVTLATSEAGA